MVEYPAIQRVEIRFAGSAPTGQIERASGVTDVRPSTITAGMTTAQDSAG